MAAGSVKIKCHLAPEDLEFWRKRAHWIALAVSQVDHQRLIN